ncbi:hypothetical protein H5410_000131, partial [Solanum commersonii]
MIFYQITFVHNMQPYYESVVLKRPRQNTLVKMRIHKSLGVNSQHHLKRIRLMLNIDYLSLVRHLFRVLWLLRYINSSFGVFVLLFW